ncbi:RNA 2',3'-cyclic phosphodiesterase [Methylomonas sp. EFPC1]|uniref:RNA 2',3'-cyclic phosphodiesterase n=1 Tax=Methylomonas sp. EFPC1 TaxID=2812647 RepID=UPI00196700E7|nr:RNA 2',3'-cyclic phosphodiesterase [Methylomonas sp. EFPC1]QSB00988.1 RNA 2',3'-cyclic phosphodiesterase [Methylomonas sp. EFPC1]
MKRLFFALWPEQNARQQCAALISQLNRTGKPVKEANLHVTALFLGRISAEQQAIITREAGKMPTPLITLNFDRLSFWKKPAVLCLTASQFDQSVSTLNENLARIAKQQGIPIENRLFKPHVTLVKKASSAIDFDFAPILWQSIGFCLVESCSGPDGVEYRIIQRWPAI